MKTFLCGAILVLSLNASSQADTMKWIRAFPITDYIKEINDSVKIVQVNTDADIPEKQVGMVRAIYRGETSDTATIGTGKCQLIKGTYHYFTINLRGQVQPQGGDLLYTYAKKPVVYIGQIVKIASHYIVLQDVYEKSFFERDQVFLQWTKPEENALMDSMTNDIHFTGQYFLENDSTMNVKIKGGKYDGKKVLQTMKTCTRQDLLDFLSYMIARPRLYAGLEWKIAEIFATWLSAGAPTVAESGKAPFE